MSPITRRVITGHAADGRSIILDHAVVPHVRALPGARFDEVWATAAAPEALDLAPSEEPTSLQARIGPQAGGSSLRIIHFAPASQGGQCSPMHRTKSVDYGIVLEGEIVLILSDSEVVLRPGDVVVQRGTDHAWENRGAGWARMAFILIDAEFTPELADLIAGQELTA